MVLISNQILPGPSPSNTPSAPSMTERTAAGEGRQVMTRSQSSASSRLVSAHSAPCSSSGRAACRSRSRTTISNPLRHKPADSLEPTLPNPMKPTRKSHLLLARSH